MKRKITIVLKSGYAFDFQCDTMKVKSLDNVMTGFSFDGATGRCPMYMRMDDISAVIDEAAEAQDLDETCDPEYRDCHRMKE